MMDYESQVNELKEGLAKLQNSHFVEALNGQRFLTGAEVNEFCREIQAREHGKELNVVREKIMGFSSASGGRVAILCCSERVKGCSFIIKCTRGRDDDKPFTVDEKRTNLVHGGITPGTDEPMICLGVITPSSSDVCTDPIYLALRGKGSNRKGKGTSTKVVKAAYAIHHGVSAPTTDVVKKANAMSKVSLELVETYNYILSFCEIAKEMNPDFCYDIKKDSLNRVNKMAVLFPHCKKMFPRCHPLLGLDSAHLPVVKLKDVTTELLEKVKRGDLVGKSGFILKKSYLTFLTGRTMNNEMIVFGYMIHPAESVDDIKYFLKFMLDSGLNINQKKITVLTDRGVAFPGPIKEILPLSFHCLCALHLKRNLVKNVPGLTPGEISQYWKMRGATTQHEYNEEMKVLETMKHGPACVAYLNGVDGVWQLYKVIERGNIIHEVKSDNIVEATFSVHLEERHDPSLFVFLQEMYCRCCERMNKMKQKIQDLGQQEILVPVAKARFNENVLSAKHAGYEVSYSHSDPKKLRGIVTIYKHSPPRPVRYNVNFVERICNCKHWEQSGVPCVHALALLLQYDPRKGGPLPCLSVYFYDWCLAKPYRLLLSDTILEVPHLPEVIHRATLEPDKYAMFPRFTATTGVSASSKRIASQGDKASGGGMSQGALRSLGRYDCVRCNTNLAICSTHPSSRCGLNIERAEKKRNPGCTFPVNKPYEVSAAAEHIPFTFDESLFDDMASDP